VLRSHLQTMSLYAYTMLYELLFIKHAVLLLSCLTAATRGDANCAVDQGLKPISRDRSKILHYKSVTRQILAVARRARLAIGIR
jgi:hypothetical protein